MFVMKLKGEIMFVMKLKGEIMFDIEMLPNVCYVLFETSVRGIKFTKYLRFDRTWRQITNHEWLIPKLIQNGAKERIWLCREHEEENKCIRLM